MNRYDKVCSIVDNIRCLDRRFVVTGVADHDMELITTIHVEYYEVDVTKGAGAEPELQKSRRWIIEPDADENEIVNTCFACVMRSYDHVVQEHFTYQGARVFSPHFEIHDRLQLAARYR